MNKEELLEKLEAKFRKEHNIPLAAFQMGHHYQAFSYWLIESKLQSSISDEEIEKRLKRVMIEAVTVLWLNDRSDYARCLYTIVSVITDSPDIDILYKKLKEQ